MHFLQAIKSDLSVFIVCNKTGGTIKGDIIKNDQRRIERRLATPSVWNNTALVI